MRTICSGHPAGRVETSAGFQDNESGLLWRLWHQHSAPPSPAAAGHKCNTVRLHASPPPVPVPHDEYVTPPAEHAQLSPCVMALLPWALSVCMWGGRVGVDVGCGRQWSGASKTKITENAVSNGNRDQHPRCSQHALRHSTVLRRAAARERSPHAIPLPLYTTWMLRIAPTDLRPTSPC